MIKFLFINAIDPFSEVQARFPQLGIGYLISSINAAFGHNKFKFKVITRNIAAEIKSFRPDVVGITAVSQNYNYAKKAAFIAKQAGLPVIIGGIHISTLPGTMTDNMDVAVIGEGEQTIVDLMDAYIACESFPHHILDRIPGLAYRENGQLHMTAPRSFISPLDRIPIPDRENFPLSSHGNVFSSRGCPYRCTFCSSTRYWDKVRFFSAEYVIEELRAINSLRPVKRISFYDDLMIADRKRLDQIAALIRRDPALQKIKYVVNARANLVTDSVAETLASMNVVAVGMGLESGNEKSLAYLKGGNVTVRDNLTAIQNLHRYGITANASFIIGSPDETREEILQTLDFIKHSGLDFSDTYVLIPLPGTPVWDYAKSIGVVSDDMDWDRLNVYHSKQPDPVIVSKHIGADEMRELYEKFRRTRLMIAARKTWFHPFFPMMVQAGLGKIANTARRWVCPQSL